MKKSLLRKRLLILSVLLLMVCGQIWAERSGSAGVNGMYNGIKYTLYSNYSYYYDDLSFSCDLEDVAVITSFDGSEMIIPETLGGYSQIVIGKEALNSNVKVLRISKSVKLLEFNAVYKATKIEFLTIEDGATLVCFGAGNEEQSMQNGSFSYITSLKSVYFGGNLEYDNSSSYYNAPFYKLNTNAAFDLTIGPNVTSIPENCFGNCDDIKSIKAMPQTPPSLDYNAFGNTSKTVSVKVSYKTKNAYTSASDWKKFTNYVLDIDLCKTDALNDLDAEAGQNPSDAVKKVLDEYKGEVNNASGGDEVVEKLNAGKAAIQLQKAKDSAIAALNTEAGDSPSEAVAGERDTWIANVNKATTIPDVETQKNNGIAAIQLQKEKETAIAVLNEEATTYPSDAADEIVSTYTGKINAATSTTDVTNEKEAGIKALKDAKDLQDAKEDAIAELTEAKEKNPSGAADNIFNTYKEAINAAGSIDEVTAAKEEGIQALQEYVEELKAEKASAKAELEAAKSQYPSEYADDIVNNCKTEIEDATTIEDVKNAKEEGIKNLQLEYNNLLNIKNAAIAELDKAKEEYPSVNASSIVAEGKNAIENAKSQSEVSEKKEYYILQLETAFEAELYNAKNDAINALNQAKDEYPSDEFEDIVSTYTDRINAATSTDAVTAIKEEGIQALAYATEMPTVLHINFAEGSAPIEKEHYMTASKFTLDEDCNVVLTINGNSVTYPWDMAGKITLFKGAPAVELKANKDPNGSEYYTTFYSSLEAYTIPDGVKAYTATLDEGQDGVIHLNEIKEEVIPAGTAVVLISESGSYNAHPSDYVLSKADEKGILDGTDVEIIAPANCYILSGTSKLGMGLYPWTGTGKTLAANKAYLQLTEVSLAKAFTFVIDGETTSIESLTPTFSEGEGVYNLQGIRVNDSYKGIVIKNRKKTLKNR